MGKRVKTSEAANQRLTDIGSEYICTEYSGNTRDSSKFYHATCGHTWNTSLTHVIEGTCCARCSGKEPIKTREEANQRLIAIGSEYICTEYSGSTHNSSKFYHATCGYTWNTSLSSIINDSNGCARCSGKEPIKTIEEANQRLIDIGSEYICTEYAGRVIGISEFYHAACDYVWNTSLNHIISHSSGCARCSGKEPIKTREEANQRLITIGSEYVCTEYSGNVMGISTFHHPVCGHSWCTALHNIISHGTGCPSCASSKGESQIWSFLLSCDINPSPIQQYSPEWIGRKRYDFYIPSHNLIIEYHGKQHYEYNQFFHRNGIQDLIDSQQVDAYKKRMAIERGYKFLEISYKDFDNIETILKGVLCQRCIYHQKVLSWSC